MESSVGDGTPRLPAEARPGEDPRSRSAARSGATSRSSSSSGTTPGGSTTTCVSSGQAPSRAGPCRRGSVPRGGAPPRSARRGPPAGLCGVRGRDPGGPVRGRDRRDLGPGTYELLEEKRGGGLTVRLHGERAQGVWTLVPARLDGDERNWLLLRKDAPEGARSGVPPAARRPPGAAADGRGLALRAEVGRLPRDRDRVRGRGDSHEAERQRLDRALSLRRPRAAAKAVRTPSAVLDGEVCALDEDGSARFEALQSGSGGSS